MTMMTGWLQQLMYRLAGFLSCSSEEDGSPSLGGRVGGSLGIYAYNCKFLGICTPRRSTMRMFWRRVGSVVGMHPRHFCLLTAVPGPEHTAKRSGYTPGRVYRSYHGALVQDCRRL